VIFDSHMHVGSFESMFGVSLDRDGLAAEGGVVLGHGGRDHVPASGHQGKSPLTPAPLDHPWSGTVDIQGGV
jgi:hypothetical protein